MQEAAVEERREVKCRRWEDEEEDEEEEEEEERGGEGMESTKISGWKRVFEIV